MDLSIIIVNYNTKKLITDCIESIFKFPPKISFEVIVVDNGSTDGSIEDLRKNKKIVLIENRDNLGFSKANNTGIKKASGEYILLLNSDTKIKKNSIDALINFAKEKEDVAAVGSKLLNSDGSIQSSAFRFPTLIGAIKQYWLGQKNILDKYAPKTTEPVEVDVLVMASFLITPRGLKEVGLLDERYFMYYEDFEYCRRIKEKGLKVYYLPGSEVVHYHGASGKKITNDSNQWRRLIPSSRIYHGILVHNLLFLVHWISQKVQKACNYF